jgi:hypothetical protein
MNIIPVYVRKSTRWYELFALTPLDVIYFHMSSYPNRKWRRTTITQRDGTLTPLPDNWSHIDLDTGVAVAQPYKDTGYEDRPAWRVISRSMNEEG